MHKNATKCNETLSKWCKNKHGASKIMDTLETCQATSSLSSPDENHALNEPRSNSPPPSFNPLIPCPICCAHTPIRGPHPPRPPPPPPRSPPPPGRSRTSSPTRRCCKPPVRLPVSLDLLFPSFSLCSPPLLDAHLPDKFLPSLAP
jgi:hypothetical protein